MTKKKKKKLINLPDGTEIEIVDVKFEDLGERLFDEAQVSILRDIGWAMANTLLHYTRTPGEAAIALGVAIARFDVAMDSHALHGCIDCGEAHLDRMSAWELVEESRATYHRNLVEDEAH